MSTDNAIELGVSARPQPGRVFWMFARLSLSQYQHNWVSLFMTIGVPLVFMLIYAASLLAWSAGAKVTIAIDGQVTEALNTKLASALGDDLRVIPANDTPQAMLDARRAHFILVTGTTPTLHARPTEAPMANLLAEVLAADTPAAGDVQRRVRVRLVERPLQNLAFLPGIVLMALLNLGLFAAGGRLLRDRGSGELRLYRQLPVSLSWFFGAELSTKLLLAVLQSAAFLWLGSAIFDVPLASVTALTTIAVCAVAAVAMLSLGYAMGATLPGVTSGQSVLTGTNLLMVFVGDLFFPLSQFDLTRPLVAIFPTTHAANLLRHALLSTPPSFPLAISWAFLFATIGSCLWIAVTRFRFTAQP